MKNKCIYIYIENKKPRKWSVNINPHWTPIIKADAEKTTSEIQKWKLKEKEKENGKLKN